MSLVWHILSVACSKVRRRPCGPGQGDEDVVALFHPGTGAGGTALETQPQIGREPEFRVCVGIFLGRCDGLAVSGSAVLPTGADAVVVERWLAVHHQLHGATDAAHGAQQDVLGVPVQRGAAMGG
jgi:hypothetical protein